MKKFMILCAVLTVSVAALIAVNANVKVDDQFDANVEALADGEGSYDGALWSNSAGNLYCCGPGNVRDCSTSSVPGCGF